MILASYQFNAGDIPVKIEIKTVEGEYVPIYKVSVTGVEKTTELILEKIKSELVKEVSLDIKDLRNIKRSDEIRKKFEEKISFLVKKYFPDASEKTTRYLAAYLIQKSIGLGSLDLLIADDNLEEIAINNSEEAVWVYHKKYGWLKTNIKMENEDKIYYYASSIGRRIGRQITLLEPLMDATLETGDRVNATLEPISTFGNTITIRKFSRRPWTITDFIASNTISIEASALLWLAVQYELSTLISGGTASGKTSMLNVISNFFPPNQRIISIEDTREITLPKFLHWVPMTTRLPNPEGKGGVSMLDLIVNSLRMRPDRIIVGEIRRQREAEVMFEAMHTGHSVYATVHANNTKETIVRLTNPPINIPKTMLPAISLIVVQYRNRRVGYRRTFQVAEILPDGDARVLMQWNAKKDRLEKVARSVNLMNTLETYTGYTRNEIQKDLIEKGKVLKWLVKHKVNNIHDVGYVMAEYYTNKKKLMDYVNKNKPIKFKAPEQRVPEEGKKKRVKKRETAVKKVMRRFKKVMPKKRRASPARRKKSK
ncbi:MAG: hypothetical protein DRO96_01280 [Candidatus Aenigmatarchaeota archaeon]|nr:MAG: hypothetical protein DRO96_01280 [Candidatus Aenigmarchaeota archaeon]